MDSFNEIWELVQQELQNNVTEVAYRVQENIKNSLSGMIDIKINKINVTVRIPIKLCEFALSEPKIYPISNKINKLMRKSISYSNFLLIEL